MQADFSIVLGDIIVYFIAVFYAVIILTIADIARKKRNLGSEVTRRIVHLFAGAAIWTVPYYPHPWVATLVALTFVIMLGLANTDRFSGFFAAMARPEDTENNSVRGPFWYAVSITILTGIFTFTGYYEFYFIAGAAIHIMMFGDGMSAPIGMKYGQNSTREIFGSKRSVPGTLAVFIFGFLGSLLAFWWFGIFSLADPVFVTGGNILWFEMVVLALIGAITATLVEFVSPKGTDNITLPLIACLVMFIFALQLGVIVV
ncbi:MAG: diacylglycerol/polyprenol kinase family protein [Candidatus Thorarchaeota archaeon]|jgi:phytol kinase